MTWADMAQLANVHEAADEKEIRHWRLSGRETTDILAAALPLSHITSSLRRETWNVCVGGMWDVGRGPNVGGYRAEPPTNKFDVFAVSCRLRKFR